ncbi:hypothetical protein HMPREF2134_06635 [Peptoniphilus lacrimalis DNF00528]|jgi:putative restriction enzyme|nr:hypothetical protein HMPREF2134_06635 [Peptoniphilus lacrimalis DNF00528]
MLHYNFTNDLRITNLLEMLKEVANLVRTDTLPTALEDKSLNNNANTLIRYFSLYKGSNNLEEAEFGDSRNVVLNFMSKFQFPNDRKKADFDTQVNQNIRLKPYQVIVKLLYIGSLSDSNFYLTQEEIFLFIFLNPEVATTQSIDYSKLLRDVLDYRGNHIIPPFVEQTSWKQPERQLREMLRVMTHTDIISFEKGVVKFENVSNFRNSRLLSNLLFDNRFIDGSGKSFDDFKIEYQKYMDLEEVTKKYITEDKLPNQIFNVDCNLRDQVIQEIHFGAPGTGKSHSIKKIIRKSYPEYEESDSNPFVLRTTIHGEYSHFDFVGNVMPISKNGVVGYEFTEGIFTTALIRAMLYKGNDVYLILEEMSRGDIASIFGDVFQLLDRNEQGVSEYRIDNSLISDELVQNGAKSEGDDKIYLPSNLHIIGTVNTSDQNVNVLDTAFKRRFSFVYESVKPSYNTENGEILNSVTFNLGGKEFEWNQFYLAVNQFIVSNLGLSEDKQLGQFFVKFNEGVDVKETIKNKVLHYLWEDVQNASMSDEASIFNNDIRAFSILYDKFDQGTSASEIFSDAFLETYDGQKVELSKK